MANLPSFVLIIGLLFCYTGVGSWVGDLLAPSVEAQSLVSKSDCHAAKAPKPADGFSYNATDGEMTTCCGYALPNAPDNFDITPDLCLFTLKSRDVETESNSIFLVNLEIKRQSAPPDLFILNSSLLI